MEFKPTKNTIQNIFIFALFALMFVLVVLLFNPFYSIILWSLLLYFIASPLYKKIVSKFNKEKRGYGLKCSLMSGIFAVLTVLIIVVLFVFIGVRLISQGVSFMTSAEEYIKENPNFMNESEFALKAKSFLEKNNFSTEWMENFSIRQQLINFFQKYSSNIFSFSKTLISGTGNMLISLVFLIFVLFFFYRDASYLSNLFIKAIPINSLYMNHLLSKFSSVIRGLISGYLLVAFYQGVVAFILMKIFSVPSALLFSVILMFVSFIPMLGAAIVWAPIGIVLCITVSVWKGILYLVLSAILVSGLDNFLRPMLLKDRIKVHPLIIFFAILGGIKIFGFNGLILGPLVVIMFFTLLDLLSSEEFSTDGEGGNLSNGGNLSDVGQFSLSLDENDSLNNYTEEESNFSRKLKSKVKSLIGTLKEKKKSKKK